jgi:hypothetical protein
MVGKTCIVDHYYRRFISDCWLAKQAIFQLHHDQNKLHFDDMMVMSALY